MPCAGSAQVAQVVAQELHAQHVRTAARACHATALARVLLADLSPLRGSTLPWCGPAAGPQVLRAVLSDRASLMLA